LRCSKRGDSCSPALYHGRRAGPAGWDILVVPGPRRPSTTQGRPPAARPLILKTPSGDDNRLRQSLEQHPIRRALESRILVIDGAMGTQIQSLNLSAADFGGPDLEGCNENLVLSRPEAIRAIHDRYLEAGADIVETDT